MPDWKGFTTEDTESTGEIVHHIEAGGVATSHREFTSWSRRVSLAGVAGWAVIAVLARTEWIRIGVIELLFLFGPLVIVPLGMELQRMRGIRSDGLHGVAQLLQPFGALMAATAICLPPGAKAGSVALGWFAFCAIAAFGGARDLAAALVRGKPDHGSSGQVRTTLAQAVFAIARIDLLVGGAWLVASRLGMRPLGIQEPIGLLTAVHFHFAGFATATIAGTTLQFAESRGEARWLRRVAGMLVSLPFVIAIGFVTSSVLKMSAAVLFSASVPALAGFLWRESSAVEYLSARILLRVAASAVFAGMALSTAYAIADFAHSQLLPIPLMASTHGVINAVGFCMCGLLGWVVESA